MPAKALRIVCCAIAVALACTCLGGCSSHTQRIEDDGSVFVFRVTDKALTDEFLAAIEAQYKLANNEGGPLVSITLSGEESISNSEINDIMNANGGKITSSKDLAKIIEYCREKGYSFEIKPEQPEPEPQIEYIYVYAADTVDAPADNA